MRCFLTLIPATAFFVCAHAIPAEAPWAVTAQADVSKTTEDDVAGSDHMEADFQSQTSSTKTSTSIFVTSTTVSTASAAQITPAPTTLVTSTTSGPIQNTCTNLHSSIEWCYPAAESPLTTAVPSGSTDYDDSDYVQENATSTAIVESTITNTNALIPWLPGTNWNSKVTNAPIQQLVVTMFSVKWISNGMISSQYAALRTVAGQYQGQAFYRIDIDDETFPPGMLSDVGLRSIPTYVFWKGGKQLGRLESYQSTQDLQNAVKRYL